MTSGGVSLAVLVLAGEDRVVPRAPGTGVEAGVPEEVGVGEA
jgi:hypothetical protein